MSTEQKSDVYFKVYTAQKGGQLPSFRGSRKIQYGSGFGDILRSINRHVLPVTAEHASAPPPPPSKPVIEEEVKPNSDDSKVQEAMSGSGKQKKTKKKSPKKKPVYKGKKRRGQKRKLRVSETSSKIPNFNF